MQFCFLQQYILMSYNDIYFMTIVCGGGSGVLFEKEPEDLASRTNFSKVQISREAVPPQNIWRTKPERFMWQDLPPNVGKRVM